MASGMVHIFIAIKIMHDMFYDSSVHSERACKQFSTVKYDLIRAFLDPLLGIHSAEDLSD